MRRVIATIVLTTALSSLALAHGKEKHVMGTVTNISGNAITVQTTSKQAIIVNVKDETKFQQSGANAALKDLKIGDKVVIHAEEEAGTLTAHQVKFGAIQKTEDSKAGEHAAHTHSPSEKPKQ